MKILYGIQATGNGHISRSREMVRNLRSSGNDVTVLFSGRKANELWDVDDFEPYIHAEGLTFKVRNGRIKHLDSLMDLNPVRFMKDIWKFDVRDFELVIADFEPVSAWIAKLRNIPSIGLGHQYAFHYNIPMTNGDLLGKLIIKNFAPVDIPLGLHWHHFNQPLLPPIVPNFQTDDITTIPDKILVYLPFEDSLGVLQLFMEYPDYQFHIYSDVDEPEQHRNVAVKPFGRYEFLNDLHSCEGVICNSGFELPSEALRLGKKLLVKPVVGQMEQNANAKALEQLKLGTILNSLNTNIIALWLRTRSREPIQYPDVSALISQWINTKDYTNTSDLVHECWKDVNLT